MLKSNSYPPVRNQVMRAESGIVHVEILDNKTTADMTGDR
jgi:hypothetical protein